MCVKPDQARLGIDLLRRTRLVADPQGGRRERAREYELELKAIVQKNFLDERLVWVANLTIEPEWEREMQEGVPGARPKRKGRRSSRSKSRAGCLSGCAKDGGWGSKGAITSDYPDWTHGLHRETYSVSAGPTVHYVLAEVVGFTATWLPQLFGRPAATGPSLELGGHEKREFRVKLGYEF